MYCWFISTFNCSFSGRLLASGTNEENLSPSEVQHHFSQHYLEGEGIFTDASAVQQTMQHFPFVNISTNTGHQAANCVSHCSKVIFLFISDLLVGQQEGNCAGNTLPGDPLKIIILSLTFNIQFKRLHWYGFYFYKLKCTDFHDKIKGQNSSSNIICKSFLKAGISLLFSDCFTDPLN